MRDLTDSDQNQAMLDMASAVAGDRAAAEGATASHGPAVAAEAMAAARSRQRLGELTGSVHPTVVWAMYGETGRMVPRAAHPHGEDFVRAKVGQLDWLTGGLPGVTWSIIACDDGCPVNATITRSAAARLPMAKPARRRGLPRLSVNAWATLGYRTAACRGVV